MDFFPELKPENLYNNPTALNSLKKRLERLWTPGLEPGEISDPQTFDCLIMSFQPENTQEWRFKVFNTVLNSLE